MIKFKKAQGGLQSLPQRLDALFLGDNVGNKQEGKSFFLHCFKNKIFPSQSKIKDPRYLLFTSGSLLLENIFHTILLRLDGNAASDTCSFFVDCVSGPASVMWELMMLVWRSRRCHFPSSAAAVTWQPSERSIRCDEAALCLHTEFNHGSPHLQRPERQAVQRDSESLWHWRWKEMRREEDSKKQSFVNT